MQKWEYQAMFTKTAPNHSELNQRGKEGWELVTVIAATSSMGIGYVAYFKRPAK